MCSSSGVPRWPDSFLKQFSHDRLMLCPHSSLQWDMPWKNGVPRLPPTALTSIPALISMSTTRRWSCEAAADSGVGWFPSLGSTTKCFNLATSFLPLRPCTRMVPLPSREREHAVPFGSPVPRSWLEQYSTKDNNENSGMGVAHSRGSR